LLPRASSQVSPPAGTGHNPATHILGTYKKGFKNGNVPVAAKPRITTGNALYAVTLTRHYPACRRLRLGWWRFGDTKVLHLSTSVVDGSAFRAFWPAVRVRGLNNYHVPTQKYGHSGPVGKPVISLHQLAMSNWELIESDNWKKSRIVSQRSSYDPTPFRDPSQRAIGIYRHVKRKTFIPWRFMASRSRRPFAVTTYARGGLKTRGGINTPVISTAIADSGQTGGTRSSASITGFCGSRARLVELSRHMKQARISRSVEKKDTCVYPGSVL